MFCTCVACGSKVCNTIFDGDSSKNIISIEVVKMLKLPFEQNLTPF